MKSFRGYGHNQSAPGGAQEGDRGLGGALAGGLAGGFAGHKADHGILGTIGGAIMGSVVEDAVKKHKNHGEGHHQQGGYTESYGGTGYPQGQHHGSQGSQHHSGLLGSLENAAGSFLGKK